MAWSRPVGDSTVAPMGTSLRRWDADVVVVGAGIIGLAHAVDAVRRGLSVTIVERDERANGASIRNFGHCYVSAQAGDARELALASRSRWLELAVEAGFRIVESGTVLVARLPEELEVIREFAAGHDDVAVLEPDEVLVRAPVSPDGVVGGLWTAADCRVDPREAIPAIARWLEEEHGVTLLNRTTALGVETGSVATSRGEIGAGAIVVAAGDDLDRLFPDAADIAGMRRCSLQMLRVTSPGGRTIVPALTAGTALLRYARFADCPSLPALRARVAAERPELIEAGVNLIVTQRDDGDLVVGDTHAYDVTPEPFRSEALDRLLLDEAASLLGSGPLEVRERWLGVYAYAPDLDVLVISPSAGVRGVTVTTGIGMTIGLGLAERVLDELCGHPVTI